MKFQLTITAQQKARLKIISNLADGKINPIYANVKITLKNESITIFSSNNSQHAQMTCDAQIEDNRTSIAFCVNADRLASVFTGCGDDQVLKGEIIEDKLVCRIGRSKATIKMTSKDATDFPDLPQTKGDVKEIFINYDHLVRTFLRSGYAVGGVNEPRPPLKNIHLETNNKNLYMVSTNGHRLCVSSCPIYIEGELNERLDISVSANFFQLLFNGIKKFQGKVKLMVSPKTIHVSIDGLLVSSSLCDQQYPNYKKVIPKEYAASTVINRNELLQAVKRVANFAGLENMDAIEMLAENGELKITGENNVDGNSDDVITLDDSSVSFTTKLAKTYLLDALERTEVDEQGQVQLNVTSNRSVTLICTQNAINNSLSVITPRN